jgi:hypothetical protein
LFSIVVKGRVEDDSRCEAVAVTGVLLVPVPRVKILLPVAVEDKDDDDDVVEYDSEDDVDNEFFFF